MRRLSTIALVVIGIIATPFVYDTLRCGKPDPASLKRVMVIVPAKNGIVFSASAPNNCLFAHNVDWYRTVMPIFKDREFVLRPTQNSELKFGVDFTGSDIASGAILVNKDVGTVVLKLNFNDDTMMETAVVNGEYRLKDAIDRSGN